MPVSPESHLISSVLNNEDLKTAMGRGISADMFHTFRDEWKWVEDYYRRYRRSPTREAFKAAFPDFRTFKTSDTAYFTDEVRKNHVRKMLIDHMNDVAELLAGGDIDMAVKTMGSSIVSIASSIGRDTDIFTDYTTILQDVEARVRRHQEQGSAGVPSGVDTIDLRTGGFFPADLSIVSARLGGGKSWVMQYMASNAASAGYTVMFNALEQSRAQVGMRIHALLSGSVGRQVFPSTALMQGKDFDVRQYRQFLRKLKQSIEGRLHVSDASQGRVSPLTIAAQIERHQPDIVFVDYLTLMQRPGSDWQGIAQLSSEMKSIATSYQIPIVAAAQLNRQFGLARGEPAGPEALAGSDAIGQDADMVITMKQMSPSVLAMKMAKNRNGPGGFKWYMQFAPDRGVLAEVTHAKAMDLVDADRDIDDKESAE